MIIYKELKDYYYERVKSFSEEFYEEMFDWNQERKRLEDEISLKKTHITANHTNAYGEKRKSNGRWNYD